VKGMVLEESDIGMKKFFNIASNLEEQKTLREKYIVDWPFWIREKIYYMLKSREQKLIRIRNKAVKTGKPGGLIITDGFYVVASKKYVFGFLTIVLYDVCNGTMLPEVYDENYSFKIDVDNLEYLIEKR
jgi:hypothetical protein